MVKYPTGIDTDAELPRVDDNISEIGGEAINSLRAAVFAIEKALGIKPQGTAADVAARLGVSLDNNGYIKASALSGIGLVTLPIDNAQVGSAAGIEESKLDLDYGTALLKSWIDSLRVRVDALEVAVAADIAHLASHVASPSAWGRHRTSDIDGYVGTFVGMNAQGALANLDTRLNAHLADPVDAHDGSAISLDAGRFTSITATDVQSAAEQLEDLQLDEIVRHRDRQHGNGILGTQDAFVPGTRHGIVIIAASATTSAVIGNTFIKFAVAPNPSAFQSIRRNDRVDFITSGGKTYTFAIDSTQSTNQVNIFGSMPVSGVGQAVVYRNTEETLEPSVAMVCVRRGALGTLPYDATSRSATLQVVHPTAPYVLSSGFRGSSLSSLARNLRLLYPKGDTGNMDAYAAMSSFFSWKSAWTAENVAKVINAALLSPGTGGSQQHPIVAFAYKGELGFAYDLPDADGYLEIGAVSSYDADATATLGFIPNTIAHAVASRMLYIDGYEFQSLKLLLDAYGQVTASDTITFLGVNPAAMGVRAGHLAKVSVWAPGTYIIKDVSPITNVLEFDAVNEVDFTAFIGRWLRVRVYADAFSLDTAPDKRTLYETFLDGYADGYGPVASFRVAARATYADMPGSISSLEGVFDLTAVSRTFGSAERRLLYSAAGRTVALGSLSVGPPYVWDLGAAVKMPSATPQGYRFTLYEGNNVDYLEFEVVGALPGSDGYLDITLSERISEERFLQLSTTLCDGVKFAHFKDTRQFGNVGRQDVRDDFTRDYVSYPRSLLRGNGVIYGFVASGESTTILTVTGGQALVNGQLKSVGKTTFIPTDGAVTYNLFMDTDGALCLRRNDEFVSGFISTPGIGELLAGRTETVLAQVTANGSNVITDIIDLRRFVNDIDSKLDLLVEENDITHGSFASLKAAIDYLNSLPTTSGSLSSASSRRIRVRGEVLLSEPVYLPWNTVLEGDGYGFSGTTNRSARITCTASDAYIQSLSGNTIRNLAFFRSKGMPTGFIYTPDPVTYLTVENCVFEFGTSDDTNIAILIEAGASYSTISGNIFRKVGTAVRVEGSASYCNIDDNVVSEMRINGVFLGSSYSTSVSRNRMITTNITMASSPAFIRLGSGSGTVYFTKIADNLLIHGSAQATTFSNTHMIDVSGASVTVASLVIERNFLENAYAGYGFAKGIMCASSTMSDLVVRENALYYFSATSVGQGINIANGPQSTIVNNRLIQCIVSLAISNSDGAIVAQNIIYDDKSPSVQSAFDLQSSSGLSVVGNYVSHNGDSFLCYVGSGCVKGTIYNNVFEATGASSDRSLLLVQGDDNIFSGNKFIGNTFSDPFWSPMMVSGGDNNLIVENSFSITSVAAAACLTFSGGTGNTEVLNKGQAYSIAISTADTVVESDWGTSGFNRRATTTSSNNELNFFFGLRDVPIGANITSIYVYYYLAAGSSLTDLTFQWFSYDYSVPVFGGADEVSDAVNAGAIGILNSYITLVPKVGLTPYYMPSGLQLNRVMVTAAGSNEKIISFMVINYTL